MIDFRYHLVSIVSIFVALAVGIVLGAGPLQGGIGTQLAGQVSQLRQDMETLRSQRDEYAKTIAAQEDYATAVGPSALAGRLSGQSVALVVTPDTAGPFAELTTTALEQAGATVTTVVTLKDAYRAADTAPDRLKAATSAAADLGVLPSSDPDQLMAEVLAALLVRAPTASGPAPSPSGTPAPGATTAPVTGPALPRAAQALSTLTSAGLLDTVGDTPQRADLAVVLGGPISGTSDSVTSQTATMTTLVRVLDASSGGVVVAADTPTAAVSNATTTLVTAVRADKRLASAISSVDHADSAVGAGVLVLALNEQRSGKAGHYGIAADAKAPVPTAS